MKDDSLQSPFRWCDDILTELCARNTPEMGG
jgi:hypothetical protein